MSKDRTKVAGRAHLRVVARDGRSDPDAVFDDLIARAIRVSKHQEHVMMRQWLRRYVRRLALTLIFNVTPKRRTTKLRYSKGAAFVEIYDERSAHAAQVFYAQGDTHDHAMYHLARDLEDHLFKISCRVVKVAGKNRTGISLTKMLCPSCTR